MSERASLFGDLLALARESWIREMASRLAALGFDDYRHSDAFALRCLTPGTLAFSTLTSLLGTTRQSARKVVGSLLERELCVITLDERDGRRRNISLTPAGMNYANAVVSVLNALNADVANVVDSETLRAASSVLSIVKDTFGSSVGAVTRRIS